MFVMCTFCLRCVYRKFCHLVLSSGRSFILNIKIDYCFTSNQKFNRAIAQAQLLMVVRQFREFCDDYVRC